MKNWLVRLICGVVFAVPLMFASIVFAQSGAVAPVGEAAPANDCSECHAGLQAMWEKSAHGQAVADPLFQEAWEVQGQPPQCLLCHTTGYDPNTGTWQADGVTCAACHESVPADHPLYPASMSRASDRCAKCHSDTYFEWQASRHGQSDLTCVSCHSPHSTELKAADTSTLCSTCHGTRVATFAHTNHAAEGLTCADCHIGQTGDVMGSGHGSHDHTFDVNLATCNQCHSTDMHSPAGAMIVPANTPLPPDSMSSGQPATVTTAPTAVSPVGYALVTGLIGLALGIVLAPWLEHGFRHLTGGPKAKRTVEVKS